MRVRGGGGAGGAVPVRRCHHGGLEADHGGRDVRVVTLQGHRLVEFGVQVGAAVGHWSLPDLDSAQLLVVGAGQAEAALLAVPSGAAGAEAMWR